MNSKRRAELQRKLTLNAVPRPPEGLAERIKADIPQYLERETAPARFTRAIPFNLRIAASIVVLATSVTVAMMMVRQNTQQKMASAEPGRVVMFPPASRSTAAPDTANTSNAGRTEEVNLDIVEEGPRIPQIASARVAPPAMTPPPLEADDQPREQRDAESGAERQDSFGDAAGVVGGVVGGMADAAAAQPQMAEAAAPAPARMVTEPSPAPPAAPPSVAQSITMTAEAPMVDARRERASSARFATDGVDTFLAKKESVFGISVNAQVFNDIRATLESGRRPAASAVNVEALVNYFAGAPEKPPRKVHLEVEASPAALPAEGDHAVLRFTIDTPEGTGLAGTDARIDVVLNDAVVQRAQRVGDNDPLARESTLPYGTSVTGLYALELKPGLRSSQLVATVRLHYFANGKPQTITRLVLGKDLAKSWQRSSRRHRLASLGALWGESLKGTPGGVDVARRAEELATQAPDDVRARELARAASASAAGGR
jgi:hypothetical protein